MRVGAGTAIDLGGTAKGWIAQRALGVLQLAWPGLPGALIDLGGDLAVDGAPPEGGPWRIDVEDPRPGGRPLGTIRVGQGGVATSGPTRRRFGPGSSLHHLIDPATRRPAAAGPVAATAVGDSPVAADAHATALAIHSVDEAAAYVAARPGLGAVLVLDDGPALVLGDVDFTATTSEVAI